jgi:hypothetical protein
MSLQTLLPQDEFSSLGLTAVQDDDILTLEDYHGFMDVKREVSGHSMKSEASYEADVESLRPVNFIPEELMRNWQLSFLRRQEKASTVDSIDIETLTNSQVNETFYEPMRYLESPPPPKRFHRIFWRSLTLRIYQLERERVLATSSSDASDDRSYVEFH